MIYIYAILLYLLSGVLCATAVRLLCDLPEYRIKNAAWQLIAFSPVYWLIMAAGYIYRWWRWVNE